MVNNKYVTEPLSAYIVPSGDAHLVSLSLILVGPETTALDPYATMKDQCYVVDIL